MLHVEQILALAQDAKHCHQQQVPSLDALTATHPGILDRLKVTD
jgi:hypothetical protein